MISSSVKQIIPPSPIAIKEVDQDGNQAVELAINLDEASTFHLEAGTSDSEFTLVLSNPALLKTASVDKNGMLTLQGASTGRTAMKIEDLKTHATRFVGVVVRTTERKMPGLPSYLALGSVSQDDNGALNFWKNFGPGDTNKRMDLRYIYLNGGSATEEWPDRVSKFTSYSLMFAMTPVFILYAINGGEDSWQKAYANINDLTFMEGYYKNVQSAVTTAKGVAGDDQIGFLIEPDFLGYLQQHANDIGSSDPTKITAQTSAAYSSGVLNKGVDPDFPNTLTGFVESINYAIRKYATNALIGWQVNLWAAPENGGKGIIHKTEVQGWEQGRQTIANNAIAVAQYAMAAGVGKEANFISIDKYGLDGGAPPNDPNNPMDSYWFWNADLWNNYLLFVENLHTTTKLPVWLWQIPVGHINVSAAASPTEYNQDGKFPILDNTPMHYEDSAPTYFFGDTFSCTGARFDYFSKNEAHDPKNKVEGNAISWGNHMVEAAAAGVVAILYGAGVGLSTKGIPDPHTVPDNAPTDNFYWITKAQEYYQNPVTLAS